LAVNNDRYLAFTAPHTPFQAPQEYIDKYKRISDPNRRIYAAMITAMDDQIGRVVDTLEKRGLRRNTLIIFVVSGFWHGANWTFIIWGALNAIYIMPSILLRTNRNSLDTVAQGRLLPTLKELAGMAITFGLTVFAWIFFRANSLPQAVQMLSAVFSPASYPSRFLSGSLYLLVFALAASYATVLLLNEVLDRYIAEPGVAPGHSGSGVVAAIARYRWYWIPPLYGLVLLLVLMVTHSQDAGVGQFMYRRF
jgi:hypothetical protein